MNITKISKEIISSVKKSEFPISFEDNLLKGFSYQDLIDTVYSNERVRDEKAVNKVFGEMVKETLENAKYSLKKEMNKLIKEINRVK